MGGLRATKVRGFIAGTFAVMLIILMAAFGTMAAGIRVPILSIITDFFGFG